MNKTYIAIISLLFCTCCATQKKFYIANIKSLNSLENNAGIYALPMTIINITIEAAKTTIIPGPFYKYADKYLGIQNVPDSRKTEWNISDVKINIYSEADPDYFFTVRNKKANNLSQILSKLAEDSLILYPGHFFRMHSFSEPDTSYENRIFYTDLSVKRNFSSRDDTIYKKIFKDSIYIEIPVVKKQIASKSLEEKAEEAANFIIKLRKRRFKLLSGQYNYMPDGDALTIAITELGKLENEYLSLFTGRKYVDNYKKIFRYVPENSKQVSREILCRFSDTEGFIDSKEAKGKSIIIEINDLNKTVCFEYLSDLKTGIFKENSILVRLPDLADIKILISNKTLNETKIPVFQYGNIVPFLK